VLSFAGLPGGDVSALRIANLGVQESCCGAREVVCPATVGAFTAMPKLGRYLRIRHDLLLAAISGQDG
jgi:hypothetical protein